MKKKFFWIVCAILLAWAVFLRVYELGHDSYWMDEGYSLTIGEAIAEHGYPILDSGELGWRSPLYHFILAGVIKIFGTYPLIVRLPSVVFGILLVIVTWLLACEWFSVRVACIATVLTAFSSWEIAWSRQARMYMLLALMFWITLYAFERWQKKKLSFFWVLFFTIGTIFTHAFGWLVVLIQVFFLFLRWLWRKYSQRIFPFIFGMAGFIICIFITLFLLLLLSRSQISMNYFYRYIYFLWENFPFTLFLAIVGILFSRKYDFLSMIKAGSIWLIGLGIISFGVPLLHYRYFFFLWPSVLLFSALGASFYFETKRYKIFSLLILLIMFSGMIWNKEMTLYPEKSYSLESDSLQNPYPYKSITPQPDFRAAYREIEERSPDTLITPYPFLTRLYLHRDDSFALYADLTGLRSEIPSVYESYTGTPYLSHSMLRRIFEKKQGIILLDFFSRNRIDRSTIQYIQEHAREIWRKKSGEWSEIILYEFPIVY